MVVVEVVGKLSFFIEPSHPATGIRTDSLQNSASHILEPHCKYPKRHCPLFLHIALLRNLSLFYHLATLQRSAFPVKAHNPTIISEFLTHSSKRVRLPPMTVYCSGPTARTVFFHDSIKLNLTFLMCKLKVPKNFNFELLEPLSELRFSKIIGAGGSACPSRTQGQAECHYRIKFGSDA